MKRDRSLDKEVKALYLFDIIGYNLFTKKNLSVIYKNYDHLNKFLNWLIASRLVEEIKDVSGNVIAYRFTENIEKIKKKHENLILSKT